MNDQRPKDERCEHGNNPEYCIHCVRIEQPSSNQSNRCWEIEPTCPEAKAEIERLTRERDRANKELDEATTKLFRANSDLVRLRAVYESAVKGRKDFREAYRNARSLVHRFIAAWEGQPGHENMDRLCEIGRSLGTLAADETPR